MRINGYYIRVQGQVGQQLAEWFVDLKIAPEIVDESVLIVPSNDQAFLFGVLLRIRDFGIRLLSVNPILDEDVTASLEKGRAISE